MSRNSFMNMLSPRSSGRNKESQSERSGSSLLGRWSSKKEKPPSAFSSLSSDEAVDKARRSSHDASSLAASPPASSPRGFAAFMRTVSAKDLLSSSAGGSNSKSLAAAASDESLTPATPGDSSVPPRRSRGDKTKSERAQVGPNLTVDLSRVSGESGCGEQASLPKKTAQPFHSLSHGQLVVALTERTKENEQLRRRIRDLESQFASLQQELRSAQAAAVGDVSGTSAHRARSPLSNLVTVRAAHNSLQAFSSKDDSSLKSSDGSENGKSREVPGSSSSSATVATSRSSYSEGTRTSTSSSHIAPGASPSDSSSLAVLSEGVTVENNATDPARGSASTAAAIRAVGGGGSRIEKSTRSGVIADPGSSGPGVGVPSGDLNSSSSGVLASFLAHVSTSRTSKFNVAGAVSPPRESGRLFDAFVVVGASPGETGAASDESSASPEPSVLYSFPPNDVSSEEERQLIGQCAKFCFPSGITCERASAESSTRVMFGPLSELERIGPSFVFMFSGGEHLRYGVCVVKQEFLETPPVLAQTEGDGDFQSAAEQESRVSQRCYCLLSRFPFLHLHFEVLYALLAHERLWAQQVLGTQASADEGQQRAELSADTRENMEAILSAYFHHPVPGEGLSAVLRLPGTLQEEISFFCPPSGEDFLIGKFALPTALAVLGIDGLLAVLSACLCERSILFLSQSLGKLSCVTLSLLPLMRPFVWQGSFIPILPQSLHECLNSPVPYILGIHGDIDPDVEVDSLSTMVIDLDAAGSMGDVHVSSDPSLVLPLPHQEQLRQNLKEPVEAIVSALSKSQQGLGGRKLNEELEPRVKAALHEVQVYNHWLLASIKRTLDTTNINLRRSVCDQDGESSTDDAAVEISDADCEAVLISCNPENRGFLSRLLRSQLYQFYLSSVAGSDSQTALIDSKLEELEEILRASAAQSPSVQRRPQRKRGLTFDAADLTAPSSAASRPVRLLATQPPSREDMKLTLARLKEEKSWVQQQSVDSDFSSKLIL